jgi:hypothetical protein
VTLVMSGGEGGAEVTAKAVYLRCFYTKIAAEPGPEIRRVAALHIWSLRGKITLSRACETTPRREALPCAEEAAIVPEILPVGAESLRLAANGITLHAVAAGPVDGPLVILLHGFPEFWYGWRQQIAPLAASGLRVVAPDQRGYNLSDKAAGIAAYRLDALADDLLGLAEALGRERFAVVGHDWGAAVAWHLASRNPERVTRAAMLNAPHPATLRRYARAHPSQALKSWYIPYFQLPLLPELSLRLAASGVCAGRCAAARGRAPLRPRMSAIIARPGRSPAR